MYFKPKSFLCHYSITYTLKVPLHMRPISFIVYYIITWRTAEIDTKIKVVIDTQILSQEIRVI